MDSGLDARSTRQPASERSLTAYHQRTTDIGVTTTTSQPSNPATSWTSGPHLNSQSRNNLRQATVALDTAYERITSLRNSINNMLNRIPPEVAGTTGTSTGSTDTSDIPSPSHLSLTHDTSIGPPHSALVLSNQQMVEELNHRAERLRSLIPPSARQRLEEFESGGRSNARGEPTWDRFAQDDRPRIDRDVHSAPLRPRTPSMPDLVIPRPRDLVEPTPVMQRRDLPRINQDDSSTMIGRRVAARVNGPPGGQPSLSLRLSPLQVEQRLQAQTAQTAREIEDMTVGLNTQRSRGVGLASSRVRGDNTAVSARYNGTSSLSRTTSSTAHTDVWPNPPAGARPLRPARDITLIDTTRIALPQSISRTSSDGNPIGDYSAPARRSLSAAYREHITGYRDSATSANMSQDAPRNLANAPEVRGTLVNLLTRDRDNPFSSARQAEYSRTSGTSANSTSTGQGRRPQGWIQTRLNADGDEIDSDEDDIESSPNTRHMRMRLTFGTPSAGRQATRSHTVTIEDILWWTSGSDSEVDVLSPDATESSHSLFQSPPPKPPTRYPHPLPTLAEDMVVFPATKPPPQVRVICVSECASYAGR